MAKLSLLSPSLHPYYPAQLHLEGFSPATLNFSVILSVFGLIGALLMVITWLISGRFDHLTISERRWMAWFAFSGVTHFIVEGAVVLDNKFYQDTSGNFLKEIWKEYSKADSRYASRDSFIISMEVVTAFVEGPGCFFILYGIARKCSWRYTLQLLVSLGQLYGDVLYFATCFMEGFIHSRPEFLYFWVYFVAVNAIWIVIPACNIWTAAHQIGLRIAYADRQYVSKKAT